MEAMARFFFHFFDGERRSRDELGIELKGPEEAYLEAVAAARAMWPELLAARHDPRDCFFEVTGEDGEELFRLEFAELLDACRGLAVRPSRRHSALARNLADTHRYASATREEVRAAISEVRKSLNEAGSLLARIPTYERRTPFR